MRPWEKWEDGECGKMGTRDSTLKSENDEVGDGKRRKMTIVGEWQHGNKRKVGKKLEKFGERITWKREAGHGKVNNAQ